MTRPSSPIGRRQRERRARRHNPLYGVCTVQNCAVLYCVYGCMLDHGMLVHAMPFSPFAARPRPSQKQVVPPYPRRTTVQYSTRYSTQSTAQYSAMQCDAMQSRAVQSRAERVRSIASAPDWVAVVGWLSGATRSTGVRKQYSSTVMEWVCTREGGRRGRQAEDTFLEPSP